MMMKSRSKHIAYSDINITPMLDLAYVLLVIFIILTTVSIQGVRINMPASTAANNLDSHKTQAITVTRDGQIYLNANPVTLEQLANQLQIRKSLNPNFPVVFRGDSQASYAIVMDIMEVLKHLSITQIGLATRRQS
ncbi:ExbD/TolR family protein [Ampullimonas aquatilis]|uniref:ExbD/TolR family protein n=1 Tax=Ampullimonas aquatilis TaxID=1341549 RepID=UPI003C753B61